MSKKNVEVMNAKDVDVDVTYEGENLESDFISFKDLKKKSKKESAEQPKQTKAEKKAAKKAAKAAKKAEAEKAKEAAENKEVAKVETKSEVASADAKSSALVVVDTKSEVESEVEKFRTIIKGIVEGLDVSDELLKNAKGKKYAKLFMDYNSAVRDVLNNILLVTKDVEYIKRYLDGHDKITMQSVLSMDVDAESKDIPNDVDAATAVQYMKAAAVAALNLFREIDKETLIVDSLEDRIASFMKMAIENPLVFNPEFDGDVDKFYVDCDGQYYNIDKEPVTKAVTTAA